METAPRRVGDGLVAATAALTRPTPLALGTLGVAAAFVCSVSWPLATYSLTLATLGIVHVVSEMRYVDLRFGLRVGRLLRIELAVLLSAVIALRVFGLFEFLPRELRIVAELALVTALAATALPALYRAGPVRAVLGTAVTLALGVGVVFAPVHTLLVLAVVHNVTPLGFLAEILRGRERVLALGVGAVLFFAVPLFIATGLPWELVTGAGFADPDLSPIATGGLGAHLHAYLHSSFHDADWAQHVFAGAVFAQCMHYGAVIHVLPSLLPAGSPDYGIARWPTGWWLTSGLVLASLALLPLFLTDFGQGRAVYGIAAAVHAWVEVPLLLLAMAGGRLSTPASTGSSSES